MILIKRKVIKINKENKEEFEVKGEDLLKKIKELIKEGNIRRITIKSEEGGTLIQIPLTLVVVGALLLPYIHIFSFEFVILLLSDIQLF